MQRRYKILIALSILLLVSLLVVMLSFFIGNQIQHVSLSTQTTYITSPLLPDGRPDYYAAINQKFSTGITGDNNAAPLFLPFPSLYQSYFTYVKKTTGHELSDADSDKTYDLLHTLASTPWSTADHPDIQKWLVSQAPAIAIVEAASLRPRLFYPVLRAGRSETLLLAGDSLPMAYLRGTANLLALRATQKIHDGNLNSAWQDALTIHRLARLICQSSSLLHYVAGLSISSVATHVDNAILAAAPVSPQQAALWQKDLTDLPPLASLHDLIDLHERFALLDQITFLAAYGPNPDFSSSSTPHANPFSFGLPINFNNILRTLNHFCDLQTAATSQPRFADREAQFDALDAEVHTFVASSAANPILTSLIPLFFDDTLRQLSRLRDATLQEFLLLQSALQAPAYFTSHPLNDSSLPSFAATLPKTITEELPPKITLTTTPAPTLTLSCDGPLPLPPSPSTSFTPPTLKFPTPTRKHFELSIQLQK